MRLNKIHIRNYKSIEKVRDICIDEQIFALIGQNNAGKSTILDAIQCVFPGCKKSVEYIDFHDRNKDIVIELEFNNVTSGYLIHQFLEKEWIDLCKLEECGIDRSDQVFTDKEKNLCKKLDILYEKYEIVGDSFVVRQIVPSPNGESTRRHNETRTQGTHLSDADLKKILPPLKVIPAIRNPQNESTAGMNSYMRDLIQMLDDESETPIIVDSEAINYRELNDILAEVSNRRCKEISEIITEKYADAVGNADYEIKITSDVNISKGTSYSTKLFDRVAGLESDMLNCGTGYQSMLILSVLRAYLEMNQKQTGFILIIEEPEAYLHPSLQRKMIETLRNLSVYNQVLLSSHSAITIAPLKKNQIALVVKNGAKTYVEEIDIKRVIDELGIRPEDILLNRGIILVEGPDDCALIKCLLEKIEEGLSAKINVFYSGSCSQLAFFANAEKLINNVHTIPLLILRDADEKSVQEQHHALFEEIKKIKSPMVEVSDEELYDCIFVVGEHAIESYFMNSNWISEVTHECQDVCDSVCETYDSGYRYAIEKGFKQNVIAGKYQPKYFLEKKLDEFGWGEEKALARKHWDDSYYKKWKETIFELYIEDGASRFEAFLHLREKVNEYTKEMAKNKKNYMVEIIEGKSLEQLLDSKFCPLIQKLIAFSSKI